MSAENSYYSRLVFVGGYVYFPYFNSGNVQSCAPEVFGRFSPYCLAFTIKIILCMSLYLQPFSTWPFEIIFSHRFSFIFFSTQIHRAPRLKFARYGDELECRTESAELQLAGEFLTLIVFGMFMRCLFCVGVGWTRLSETAIGFVKCECYRCTDSKRCMDSLTSFKWILGASSQRPYE